MRERRRPCRGAASWPARRWPSTRSSGRRRRGRASARPVTVGRDGLNGGRGGEASARRSCDVFLKRWLPAITSSLPSPSRSASASAVRRAGGERDGRGERAGAEVAVGARRRRSRRRACRRRRGRRRRPRRPRAVEIDVGVAKVPGAAADQPARAGRAAEHEVELAVAVEVAERDRGAGGEVGRRAEAAAAVVAVEAARGAAGADDEVEVAVAVDVAERERGDDVGQGAEADGGAARRTASPLPSLRCSSRPLALVPEIRSARPSPLTSPSTTAVHRAGRGAEGDRLGHGACRSCSARAGTCR